MALSFVKSSFNFFNAPFSNLMHGGPPSIQPVSSTMHSNLPVYNLAFNLFNALPQEIQLFICSFLEVPAIMVLSQTNKNNYNLCNSSQLWKSLYARDQEKWKSFINLNVEKIVFGLNNEIHWIFKTPSLLKANFNKLLNFSGSQLIKEETKSELSWKTRYLVQYKENRVCNKSKTSNSSHPSEKLLGILSNSPFIKRPVPKVLILGEALRTSAKKLVQLMMSNGSNSRLPMTQLHPGMEGVGAGVGFQIDKTELNLIAVYRNKKKDYSQSSVWKEMFRTASAFVVVVDAGTGVEQLRSELLKYLKEGILDVNKPILLMICALESESEFLLSPSALLGALSMPSAEEEKLLPQIAWYIRHVIVKSLDGIYETLFWLSQALNH